MKLSKAQQLALSKLTCEWQSAYELRVGLSTLHALKKLDLVDVCYTSGSMWSPRICVMWRLHKEEAGR